MMLPAEVRGETHFPFLDLSPELFTKFGPQRLLLFPKLRFFPQTAMTHHCEGGFESLLRISERMHPKGRLEWHSEEGYGVSEVQQGHGSCLPLEMCVRVFMWVAVSLSCHSSGTKVPS